MNPIRAFLEYQRGWSEECTCEIIRAKLSDSAIDFASHMERYDAAFRSWWSNWLVALIVFTVLLVSAVFVAVR